MLCLRFSSSRCCVGRTKSRYKKNLLWETRKSVRSQKTHLEFLPQHHWICQLNYSFFFFCYLFAYTVSECVYCVGALYLRVCIDYGALHRLMSSDRIDGRRDGSRHTKIIIKKQQRKSIPEPLCSILNGRARHAASSAAYTTHTTNTQIQSLIAFDLTCDMRLFVNPPERTISWQLVWFPEIQFQPKSRMRAFRSTKSNEQYYRGCASIAYLCLPNILRKWQ